MTNVDQLMLKIQKDLRHFFATAGVEFAGSTQEREDGNLQAYVRRAGTANGNSRKGAVGVVLVPEDPDTTMKNIRGAVQKLIVK